VFTPSRNQQIVDGLLAEQAIAPTDAEKWDHVAVPFVRLSRRRRHGLLVSRNVGRLSLVVDWLHANAVPSTCTTLTRLPAGASIPLIRHTASPMRSVLDPFTTGFCRVKVMPAEPHIRSPFKSGQHHNPSFLRSSGSGGWVHTVMRHIAAIVCDGPPAPDPTRLIRPRGTRDNDSAFPDASDWLHDSTRRDLAMGDISREGDEQFAANATIEMRRVRPRSEPTRCGTNS
jgi:hypothetical protein